MIATAEVKQQSKLIVEGTTDASSSIIASSPGNLRLNYYASCFVAGGLCSSIRWILTPLDLAKIRMQVTSSTASSSSLQHSQQHTNLSRLTNSPKIGFVSTLRSIYKNEGGIVGLFRGLTPTIMAASVQTSCKYGLYEVFKDQITGKICNVSGNNEREVHDKYGGYIFLASAALAEGVADIIMCPWEMLKVQVQTTSTSTATSKITKHSLKLPSETIPAFSQMLSNRRHYNNFPFGSIGPLWARQIPGTIINFFAFEKTVEFIYENILSKQKDEYSQAQQLLVSLGAGYIAGIGNAILSHPADSILSHMALRRYQGKNSIREIIRSVGWYQLATKGLVPRIIITGNVIGTQWLLYDSIKCLLGFHTTGGGK